MLGFFYLGTVLGPSLLYYCNYLMDRHFITKSYQNVQFGDIVEIWKKLKNGNFFHKRFTRSHFKIGTTKTPKMTR